MATGGRRHWAHQGGLGRPVATRGVATGRRHWARQGGCAGQWRRGSVATGLARASLGRPVATGGRRHWAVQGGLGRPVSTGGVATGLARVGWDSQWRRGGVATVFTGAGRAGQWRRGGVAAGLARAAWVGQWRLGSPGQVGRPVATWLARAGGLVSGDGGASPLGSPGRVGPASGVGGALPLGSPVGMQVETGLAFGIIPYTIYPSAKRPFKKDAALSGLLWLICGRR